MTSIRRALLWTLLPAVLVLLALAVIAVLREVQDEIAELFDAQLVQAAYALPTTSPPAALFKPQDDPSRDLVIAVWAVGHASPQFYSRRQAPLLRRPTSGWATLDIGGEPWRTYQVSMPDRTIVVAQPLRIRNEAIAEIGGRILLPTLILIPLIVLTVLLLVQCGLRPLTRFAAELRSRSPQALGCIDLHAMPAELLPMGTAMNELLGRLSVALDAQQVFIADAAHELLTPLTALQVQVQMLERGRTAERRAQAMLDVRASLERCISLARQLLTLARQSTEIAWDTRRVLKLSDVVRAAVSEVLPKAHLRGIDLGAASETDCTVLGDEKALQTLIGNLLDNAVKYTPQGGRVDVTMSLREGRPAITVSDSGRGIAASDQPRVFDRFYRSSEVDVEGSGLGLAIAREIAVRHEAAITLRSPGRLGGLDAEVLFAPAAVEATPSPDVLRAHAAAATSRRH